MGKKRTGKLNADDINIINTHPEMTDEELAEALERSVETIRKHRVMSPVLQETKDLGDAIQRLRASHFWNQIKKQLLPEEQPYFEQVWVRLYDQFSSHEVVATDELMMKDYIMLEIASNRAQVRKKESIVRLEQLDRSIEREMEKSVEARDMVKLTNWETQRGGLHSAINVATKEHLEYQKKKDEKMDQLKGTREQRLRQAQEIGKNFWELIKELDTAKRRRADGIRAAKMKLAADNIAKKWSQPMDYEDGDIDRPLLTPEAIIEAENECAESDDEEGTNS